jgi:hypothetical protein
MLGQIKCEIITSILMLTIYRKKLVCSVAICPLQLMAVKCTKILVFDRQISQIRKEPRVQQPHNHRSRKMCSHNPTTLRATKL